MKQVWLIFTMVLAAGIYPQIHAAPISGEDLVENKHVEIHPGKMGTVLVFLSSKCPCSNNHIPVLKNLAGQFRDFTFVAVHSNADESLEMARPYFAGAHLDFPVIEDSGQKLAGEFKALRTPHAFLISPSGKILYKGGVTNSTEGESANQQLLRTALTEVSAGKKVSRAESRVLGCAISRR